MNVKEEYTAAKPEGGVGLPDLDIDAISLKQALVDAHVANLRIVAITKSVEAVSLDIVALRGELTAARAELSKLEVQA